MGQLRKILSNSLLAAIFGGVLTFLFFSISAERAANFASRGSNTLSGGLGVIGVLGTFVWNTFIAIFGALFSGFTVAIGSLIYYSFPRLGKKT
jgi:hypothetical protein